MEILYTSNSPVAIKVRQVQVTTNHIRVGKLILGCVGGKEILGPLVFRDPQPTSHRKQRLSVRRVVELLCVGTCDNKSERTASNRKDLSNFHDGDDASIHGLIHVAIHQ